MNETHSETTILACPECGGTSFSWIVRQVQFGIIHEFGSEQYSEEGRKMGPITGSDVDEKGVFCTSCEEHRDHDKLVPAETSDTAATSDKEEL